MKREELLGKLWKRGSSCSPLLGGGEFLAGFFILAEILAA